MLKYKILIKLFVLNCVFVCCIYDNTIQAEVTVFWYSGTSRHNTITSAWMKQHTNSQFSRNGFINTLYFNADLKPLFKT
jgi:hypothetical protein